MANQDISEVKELSKPQANQSWLQQNPQQDLQYSASKCNQIEKRLDMIGGNQSDVLRHLVKHFEGFSEESGGAQIFKLALCDLHFSLISGPVGRWPPQETKAEFVFFSILGQLYLIIANQTI